MRDRNICQFVGNLVADPELKQTQAGTSVVNLRLAVNATRVKNAETGEWTDGDVAYFDFEAWDSGAELLGQMKKGDRLFVECLAKLDTWKDKETGANRSKVMFRINNFIPIARRAKTESQDDDPQPARKAPTKTKTETKEAKETDKHPF